MALPAADVLAKQLRAARLRQVAGKLIDHGTVALLSAAVLAVICRVFGSPAEWILPAGVLVTAWRAFRRFPSLATVAGQLDSASETAELLSSAWLIRSSNDPWTQMLLADAAARVETIVQAQRWTRLPGGMRTSMLLAAGAIGLGGLLISPVARSSPGMKNEILLMSPTSKDEAQALVTWLAPKPLQHPTDDPEEAGRSIAMNGDAPVRHPGDDARGNGRATADEAARIKASAHRQTWAETVGNQAGTGDGSAGIASNNGSAAGGHVASQDSGKQSRSVISGEVHPGNGTSPAAAAAPAVYRPLIEAYFAR